jgi:multidrug efflux pump
MTSFAFILGVVPLLTASGAGSEMRHSLGLAVFAGMLGVTLFGIFLTPVFFYVIESLVEAPLFSSARMRQVGRVLFYAVGILTLGLPWLLRLLLATGQRPAPTKPAVATNGQAGPHGVGQDSNPDTAPVRIGILTHGNGNGTGHPASPEDDPERVAQK